MERQLTEAQANSNFLLSFCLAVSSSESPAISCGCLRPATLTPLPSPNAPSPADGPAASTRSHYHTERPADICKAEALKRLEKRKPAKV
eukprot:1918029-Rhodomonas_salina.1